MLIGCLKYYVEKLCILMASGREILTLSKILLYWARINEMCLVSFATKKKKCFRLKTEACWSTSSKICVKAYVFFFLVGAGWVGGGMILDSQLIFM